MDFFAKAAFHLSLGALALEFSSALLVTFSYITSTRGRIAYSLNYFNSVS